MRMQLLYMVWGRDEQERSCDRRMYWLLSSLRWGMMWGTLD